MAAGSSAALFRFPCAADVWLFDRNRLRSSDRPDGLSHVAVRLEFAGVGVVLVRLLTRDDPAPAAGRVRLIRATSRALHGGLVLFSSNFGIRQHVATDGRRRFPPAPDNWSSAVFGFLFLQQRLTPSATAPKRR